VNVEYISRENHIIIKVGKEHIGKLISTGNNRLPITTINKNGYIEMAYNIFKKFKEELYMGEEQLIFKKKNNELV